MSTTSAIILVLAAFLASAVEMVEALTIVLAVGVTRGWRSALIGVATATVALAVVVAALGPALTLIPIKALRLVVGALLLIFGLQWLRKAILRASGYKALHDEDAIFRKELAEARQAGTVVRAGTGLVRLHPLLQGRLPRRAGGRVHRPDLRQHAREQHPARGGGRGGGAGHRRGRRGARPRAAEPGAGEHDEVRGRRDADDLRHLLGRGGRGRRRGRAQDRRILGVLAFVLVVSFGAGRAAAQPARADSSRQRRCAAQETKR